MKAKDVIGKALGWVTKPVGLNARFCVFIYLLGCICAWVTLPHTRTAHLYENLYPELLLDVYALALVLALLPRRLRPWVRTLLAVVLYLTAIVDVYCFVRFDSTLNPSILLLVGETDSREAGEFLRSCVSPDILLSPLGWVLLLMAVHLVVSLPLRFPHIVPRKAMARWRLLGRKVVATRRLSVPLAGLLLLLALAWSVSSSWHNKAATWQLMSGRTIGEVEHTLTDKNHAVLYQPIYRLSFSIYANSLAAEQVQKLVAAADKVAVDSCSYTVPNIVLIIGESYSRHHSQQYGYHVPTTPRQVQMEKQGRLVRFTDVVAPWNLTSFVFKNVFSLHVVGQQGEWCDYPLFPEVFRKAGYHVTFLTNQFLPKARQEVYDFSGGFFLNNAKLSAAQFDTRNSALHRYDDGLLEDYDRLRSQNTQHNLIIFHLLGQHVAYSDRSPHKRKVFKADDYLETKPHLSKRERYILASYDNAVLYNDSIVEQIVSRFDNDDAVVIYMPDHGEEAFEGNLHFYCRMHSAEVDARLAHAEFDIPFWMWCSRKFVSRHPEMFRQMVNARNRRFMTDAVPHLLLYLGGISAPDYHEEYNLLSPNYDESRPRLLKGTTDYDKLQTPQP